MQPRIDTDLGIQGEPDTWVHSACILCSNGCGLDIAVAISRSSNPRPSPSGGFGQPEPWLLARFAELNGESSEPFAAREFGGAVNRAINS